MKRWSLKVKLTVLYTFFMTLVTCFALGILLSLSNQELLSSVQSDLRRQVEGSLEDVEAEDSWLEVDSDFYDLEDGVYSADFDTDSSMFHVSEACEGKGTLTVENGQMTIHVSLASQNIVNLYPGLAEDAQKEGAELLEPTVDSVTYSDGITEEVYGFDIPVPALDEEFDVALVGTKGTWYDHKVSVSYPESMEESAETAAGEE